MVGIQQWLYPHHPPEEGVVGPGLQEWGQQCEEGEGEDVEQDSQQYHAWRTRQHALPLGRKNQPHQVCVSTPVTDT